jgi:O-antigen/teichoic acid export membrane protein
VSHNFNVENYAVYAIGSTQLPLVNTVRDALVSVMLARVSSLQQQGEHAQIRDLMLRAVRKLSAFYIPVCAALFVLGRELIISFYTAKFVESIPILKLNALLLPLGAMITDPVLRAYAEYRYVTLKVRLVMLAVLVVMAMFAIHIFGMVGVMGAYVLSVTIERFILVSLCMHILKATWHDFAAVRDVLKYLGAALVACFAVMALKLALINQRPLVVLIAGSALFSVIYVAIVILSGGLDDDERRMINRLTARYLKFNIFRLAPE